MLAAPSLSMQGVHPNPLAPAQQTMSWRSWQTEADTEDRKMMMNTIYNMFEAKRQSGASQHGRDEWQLRLPHFVQRLEEELYRSAKSKADYQDVSTLQQRLQQAGTQFKDQGPSRQETQASRPPSATSPGNGVLPQARPNQMYPRGPGYLQATDGANMVNRPAGGLPSGHHQLPAPGSGGMVSSSSGMLVPNRPGNYLSNQTLANGMAMQGMRMGGQGDGYAGGLQSVGVLKMEPQSYANGMTGLSSLGDRNLVNRGDAQNPVMSNGMPVMLRGSRQDFTNGSNYLQQPNVGGSTQVLIHGMPPAQLANGAMSNGPTPMMGQYQAQRSPSGMMPSGMIPTGNPGTGGMGSMNLVPNGSQMSPGVSGLPNGAMLMNGRQMSQSQMGQLGGASSSGQLGSMNMVPPMGVPGMSGDLGQGVQAGEMDAATQQRLRQQQDRRQYVAKQQRWLLFLRHCAKCQAPDGQCQYGNSCQVAKALWRHILGCSNPHCEYPRCISSRDLLKHHQKCSNEQCPVCTPVKQYVQKQRMAMANHQAELARQRAELQTARHTAVLASQQQQALAHQQQQQHALAAAQAARAGHPGMSGAYGQPAHRRPASYAAANGSEGGMMPQNGMAYMSDQPPAKRIKREDGGHPSMMVQQQQLMKQEQQEQGDMETVDKEVVIKRNQGTSLVEVMTKGEIETHLQNLVASFALPVPNGNGKYVSPPVPQNAPIERPPLGPDGTPPQDQCNSCKQKRLVWEPASLYCSICNQKIKRNANYYMTPARAELKGFWCTSCWGAIQHERIDLDGSQYTKSELEKKKNDEETEECWVQCDLCQYWVHQICGLFNKGRNSKEVSYLCPHCLLEGLTHGWRKRIEQRPQAMLEARDLPTCNLSNYLEQYVQGVINTERAERAKRQGKSPEKTETAEGLTIRVINNVMRQTEVKPKFFETFEKEDYPRHLPYRQKVILLTQKIDGVDVCLYCLYLQEYGDDCPAPNKKWVYLSYLDSVKYFRPELQVITPQGEMALRTMVYHAVLQGYTQYAKDRGFAAMFIWVCPPLQGDDYILYVHPSRQRVPKSERLRDWYLTCLKGSKSTGVVTHLSNLVDTYFEGGRDHRVERISASYMPYFEGDYWPGEVETQIGLLTDEAKNDGKGKSGAKGGARNKSGKGKRYGPDQGTLDQRLMEILGSAIQGMKEDFIVAHLQEPCSFCRKYISDEQRWYHPDPPSKVARAERSFEGISLDQPGQSSRQLMSLSRFQLCHGCYEQEVKAVRGIPHAKSRGLPTGITLDQLKPQYTARIPDTHDNGDPEVPSEFFETRQAFLSLCQGNHYQFDTLRRARHSSMMVLYHLHNPTEPAFACTCNCCQTEIDVGAGFRCTVCSDFDLCSTCKDQGKHDKTHRLQPHDQKRVFNDTQQRLSEQEQAERKAQLDKTMALLVHASTCKDGACTSTNCGKVRALFRHAVDCTKNVAGGCQLCRRMWLLLQMHAKGCNHQDCPVPRCRELRVVRRRQALRQEEHRRKAYVQHVQAAQQQNAVQRQQGMAY